MTIDYNYNSIYEIITSSLKNNIPLSIIRYGDGEAMLLDKDRSSAAFKRFVFKRQLGLGVSDIGKNQITKNLIKAYEQADIIGIPTERHLKREDHWGKSADILKYNISNISNKKFCSVDFHSEFLDNRMFDKLLINQEELIYISSNDLDKQFKDKFNVKNTKSFIIAPEIHFQPDYIGASHYPDQFNEIKKWIKNIDCKNKLCLVGAGVVGKIYNIWFKKQGGVSIDIGSVFDSWAGKKTRGVGRGAGVIDEAYKL